MLKMNPSKTEAVIFASKAVINKFTTLSIEQVTTEAGVIMISLTDLKRRLHAAVGNDKIAVNDITLFLYQNMQLCITLYTM